MNKKIVIVLIVILVALTAVIFFVFKNNKRQENEPPKPTPEQVAEVKSIKEEKGFDPTTLVWEQIKPEGTFWAGRDSHMVSVFNNKIWLSGGVIGGTVTPPPIYENIIHGSDLWSSDDLINWTLVTDTTPWQQRRAMTSVEFNDKLWLIGGWDKKYGDTKNDVWATSDGINWSIATSSAKWLAREGHASVVFKGKMWITGGVDFFNHQKRFNDVWYSEDGKNWTEATANAPWAARYDHSLVVYKDQMWLIGGMTNGYKTYKDVWSSEDGINWMLVTDNPPWPDRHGHVSFDYKGLMWIIGGWCETEQKGLNDTWFTDDGINWQTVSAKAEWPGREDVAGIIWKDKMVIIGGMGDLGKQWKWEDDIWQANF